MRRWCRTKAASVPALQPSSASPAPAEPPCSSASPFSPSRIVIVTSTRPIRSSRTPVAFTSAPPGALCGSSFHASGSASRQNGEATKKIERHPNHSTSTPPMLGPSAGASTTPKPKSPIARPCSSGLKPRRTMIAGIGCSTPAASPSVTRIASTSSYEFERPPAMLPASSSQHRAHISPAVAVPFEQPRRQRHRRPSSPP